MQSQTQRNNDHKPRWGSDGSRSKTSETRAVYSILERGEDTRPFWLRIGSCFENRDGSFNVYLDAFPRDGKLQIRPISDTQKAGAA